MQSVNFHYTWVESILRNLPPLVKMVADYNHFREPRYLSLIFLSLSDEDQLVTSSDCQNRVDLSTIVEKLSHSSATINSICCLQSHLLCSLLSHQEYQFSKDLFYRECLPLQNSAHVWQIKGRMEVNWVLQIQLSQAHAQYGRIGWGLKHVK